MTVWGAVFVAGVLSWFFAAGQSWPLAFAPSVGASEKSVSVLFGGDMMYDRSIRNAMAAHGDDFIFSCIRDLLWESDFAVANLEGPITPYASMSAGSVVGSGENVTFTFPTSTASLLARNNIWLVNLGNNHIHNFGDEGVTETKKWLKAAGVRYFGDPNEKAHVTRLGMRGIKLSFINWSDWTGGEKEDIVAAIAAERAAGRIPIVYTHWGAEYVPQSAREVTLAHSFIDAGAEVVIGSHPHVVLGHEEYKGKYIYYSLGNFIFDQYFNEQVRNGLMLNITFTKDGVKTIAPIPTHLERDRRTCVKEVE